MAEDSIKVYRIGDTPITVPRSQVLWTDRSRIVEQCPRKRYLGYEYGGTGYISTGRNEDLLIGAAVHEGVDLLFQGGSINKAMDVARQCYMEGRPWGDWLLPEQKEILTQDGLHLVQALVYSFFVCYLDQYRDQFQVVEVEEEINWMVKDLGGRVLVCMSRPDAILRDWKTGRLWHVSHKTTKRFDESTLAGLDVDVQRFAEGYAIWAKYGEQIEGTVYNYFIKGDRRKDEGTNIERYITGLIRPYVNRMVPGPLTPEAVGFSWEWTNIPDGGGPPTKKRLGKGWEKTEIYKEMDYMTYLEWLREKWVQRVGKDYLLEAQAGMIPVFWNEEHAERWLQGIRVSEAHWHRRISADGRRLNMEGLVANQDFPLVTSQCFSYNHKCQYFDICWRGKTPDTLMEEGALTHREPNHLQEFYEVM